MQFNNVSVYRKFSWPLYSNQPLAVKLLTYQNEELEHIKRFQYFSATIFQNSGLAGDKNSFFDVHMQLFSSKTHLNKFLWLVLNSKTFSCIKTWPHKIRKISKERNVLLRVFWTLGVFDFWKQCKESDDNYREPSQNKYDTRNATKKS